MSRTGSLVGLIGLLLLYIVVSNLFSGEEAGERSGARLTVVDDIAGRFDYAPQTDQLLFERGNRRRLIDVWVRRLSEVQPAPVTAARPELPQIGHGAPVWLDGGTRALLVTLDSAQLSNIDGTADLLDEELMRDWQGSSLFAVSIDWDGGVERIVDRRQGGAIAAPVVSADGRYLAYADRVGVGGTWRITFAALSLDGPELIDEELQDFAPGGLSWYRPQYLDGDAPFLITLAAPGPDARGERRLIRYDMRTGAVLDVGDTDAQNGSACVDADGATLYWARAVGSGPPRDGVQPMDLWRRAMPAAEDDGPAASDPTLERITFFNIDGHAEAVEGGATVEHCEVMAGGDAILVFARHIANPRYSPIYRIDLTVGAGE